MIKKLEAEQIELDLLEKLKNSAEEDVPPGDEIIYEWIWGFLDDYERGLRQKSQKSIEHYYIIPKSTIVWDQISNEYDVTKAILNKQISKFIKDTFKRKIILRDIATAFIFAKTVFYKESVIVAGGVIEELLRLYLLHKKIKVTQQTFNEYINICEKNRILKTGISRLTDFVRLFRNLVHLEREKTSKYTISKATASSAVASIFTVVNDL